jgi:hypothetical protein
LATVAAVGFVLFGVHAVSTSREYFPLGKPGLGATVVYVIAVIFVVDEVRGLGRTVVERLVWGIFAMVFAVPLIRWVPSPQFVSCVRFASGIAELGAGGLLASEAIFGIAGNRLPGRGEDRG